MFAGATAQPDFEAALEAHSNWDLPATMVGERIDPLNGRTAFHSGVDLSAPYKTAVLATAPGVVSFTGVKSEYGRVVEITHAHGIVTRYAHLHRILVAFQPASTRMKNSTRELVTQAAGPPAVPPPPDHERAPAAPIAVPSNIPTPSLRRRIEPPCPRAE